MILSVLNHQLWSLVVPTCHSHIILLVRKVVVSKSVIDQSKFLLLMVDNNVEWFDVSVHDSVRMSVLQCLKNLVGVESDFEISHHHDKLFRFNVRNVLENQRWSIRCLVTHHIKQLHNVRTSVQRLQYFNLSVNLLVSDWLENLNDTPLVVEYVAA